MLFTWIHYWILEANVELLTSMFFTWRQLATSVVALNHIPCGRPNAAGNLLMIPLFHQAQYRTPNEAPQIFFVLSSRWSQMVQHLICVFWISILLNNYQHFRHLFSPAVIYVYRWTTCVWIVNWYNWDKCFRISPHTHNGDFVNRHSDQRSGRLLSLKSKFISLNVYVGRIQWICRALVLIQSNKYVKWWFLCMIRCIIDNGCRKSSNVMMISGKINFFWSLNTKANDGTLNTFIVQHSTQKQLAWTPLLAVRQAAHLNNFVSGQASNSSEHLC